MLKWCMAYNFLRGDRDQPFLLPPDLRDWLLGCRHDRRRRGGRRGPRLVELNLREPTIPASSAYVH
jgi:hypothetical protein